MSCDSPTHKVFNPLIIFLAKSWEKSSGICTAIGGVGAAILGFWTAAAPPKEWKAWDGVLPTAILIITICCLFLAPIMNAKLSKNFSYYEKTIDDLSKKVENFEKARNSDISKMQDIFHQIGLDFLQEFNLYNDHTRISLYQHERHEKCFTLLERVAKNPELSAKGRLSYPDNQGFIQLVWTSQQARRILRDTDAEKWAIRQDRDFGIPVDVARAIKMKSRSFAGLSLQGIDQKSVGLVIIESLNYDAIPTDVLDKVKNHSAYKQLCMMLSVTPHLPRNYFSD